MRSDGVRSDDLGTFPVEGARTVTENDGWSS